MATKLLLPTRSAEVVRLQAAAGRLALTGEQRIWLERLYEQALHLPDDTDHELLLLLTRTYCRSEPIPEYYRYTHLHVFDWFLAKHVDPVSGAVLALETTLAALDDEERAADPGTERVARLDAIREHLRTLPVAGGPAGRVIDEARADETRAWEMFALASCTGFTMSGRHDEQIFLRTVQACELSYFVIRWLASWVVRTADRDVVTAHARLRQLSAYADLPNRLFHLLQTLTPESFLEFRDATGAASAVQSLNYHLMELALYGYDARKAPIFERHEHLRAVNQYPLRVVRPLHLAVTATAHPGMEGVLREVERALLTWRGRHYGFGARYLPGRPGSGGTEGAGYLKRFVGKDAVATVTPVPPPTHFAYR
ncbi:tryptophan 2,3-dioxygenase family protein [Nonomuraea jabiensis]|uniref:Tryptophan 2,3-dioxygenase n=1 Tax=Nonomuraea sp. MJM5123 TaxID=1562372 RepID=A0A1R7SQM1_9ACTN|nr:hypothetical protein [Nonomuraea sp. MJM5123]